MSRRKSKEGNEKFAEKGNEKMTNCGNVSSNTESKTIRMKS
jgi:hypothetical protein